MNPADLVPESCPHCNDHQSRGKLDEHVATAHSDIPPCTARISPRTGGLNTCSFRVGHGDGEYGDLHASRQGPMGRHVWRDTASGAVLHREPQEEQL